MNAHESFGKLEYSQLDSKVLKQNELALIDSEAYKCDDKERLLALLNESLDFYAMRAWSNEERVESIDRCVETRMKELHLFKEHVLNLLSEAEKLGAAIKIEANIKVSLA